MFAIDLAVTKEREACIKSLKKKFNKIDIMINSIGMVGTDTMKGWNSCFEKQSIDAWNKAIDINLTSIFFQVL